MRFVKIVVLSIIWLLISGMEADPGSSGGCVKSDKPFGRMPELIEMETWDGWWCNQPDCHCIRVTSNVTGLNELMVDGFEDSTFWVYELRRVPDIHRRNSPFWFGFELYSCKDAKCKNLLDVGKGTDWALLRKSTGEVVMWWIKDEEALTKSIMCNELPGEYDGKEEFRLLGSILTEDEMRSLVGGKFYDINEGCPIVFTKVENLPECFDN